MWFYELREKFLNFFESKGHKVVKSSSLIPDDPSVLFTTAGMQQFKKYYTGELNPISDFGSARTTSIQKCFRTSDIDEVGDETHLTFFEMLGNFSFAPVGDDDPKNTNGELGYFKRSAIVWAWEFITEVLKIDTEKIFVTVFEGDDEVERDEESFSIWRDEIGLPEKRIFFGSREDNFWGPTGNEGPCGPTTEIYVADSKENADKGDGVEIWNVVFNEFYAKADNEGNMKYTRTDTPGIDTGMGFERLLSVLEGKKDVFETSSFERIVDAITSKTGNLNERTIRILADHIRAVVFLVGDGVVPSNKEAGYVLRRLMRRIIGIKVKNDIHSGLFEDVLNVISDQYGDIYSEVKNKKEILDIWNDEYYKFQSVISKGLRELTKFEKITGKDAFYLYESFGLPFDLINEFASDKLDKSAEKEFEVEFEKHKEISKSGAEKKFGGHGLVLDTGELKASTDEEVKKVVRMHTATHLLQWALRKLFGDIVRQMGSDINPERLRFDFTFDRKLTDGEKAEIEKLVNEKIKEGIPVFYKEMKKEDAEKIGALSFFKEKYPDVVKVYFIGENENSAISKEFCGGPHVSNTKEIGRFRILKEESVGRGVRRIRATVE